MEENDQSTEFLNEINQPTINIPRAGLVFARTIAYPDLDIAAYMARLDAMASAARAQVQTAKTLAERVDALSDFLFYQMEFRGNRSQFDDPRNSFLNCVLDRRQGIPITLTVLFVSIAARLGMHAYGISLPGHFIAGVYENGSEILVDPYNSGSRLSLADCASLVRETTGRRGPFHPKWLTAAPPESVLARMLNNLCHAYIQSEDWSSAIRVIQHLIVVQPDTDFHLRDLGYVYLYDGSLRLSAQYLEEYLRRSPDAPDFENVLSSLQIVAGRLALWN